MRKSNEIIGLVDADCFYISCHRHFEPKLRGRPVVALSSNDGNVIARSPESKKLGIKMGQPFHEVRPLMLSHGLEIRSANFPLYGDLSRRLYAAIASQVPEIDIYSCDECSVRLSGMPGDLEEIGRKIQAAVLKQTGLPTGVGIGPNRTLAKLANFAAKKWKDTTGGVTSLIDPADRVAKMLAYADVGDIWGIGPRISARLNLSGIEKANQLAMCDPARIRRDYSIVVERTVRELRGEYQFGFGEVAGPKQQIACTRSFGSRVYDKASLATALATYTSRVAVKLRKQDSRAQIITIFIRSSAFDTRGESYSRSAQWEFSRPSNDTRELTHAVLAMLEHIFRAGIAYAKAGVIVSRIVDNKGYVDDLFAAPALPKSEQLMASIDRINTQFGKDTLRFGRTSGDRYWGMKRDYLSPKSTTAWSDIPEVKTL